MISELQDVTVIAYKGKVVIHHGPPEDHVSALIAASERIAGLETQVIAQQQAGYAAAARANRVVDIENYLINVAKGNKPLPTAEDCKVMALRLGTPYAEWSDYVKGYKYGNL